MSHVTVVRHLVVLLDFSDLSSASKQGLRKTSLPDLQFHLLFRLNATMPLAATAVTRDIRQRSTEFVIG